MKYNKLFESYKDIEDICSKYDIKNYTINSDLSVDVNNNVTLFGKKLNEIPLNFNNVSGSFDCSWMDLSSLEKSPNSVLGDFACDNNHIISLEYCPKYIGSDLYIHNNIIYTLHYVKTVISNIIYNENPLYTLINLFNYDPKSYMDYLEMYNFQKEYTNIIYKTRFLEALKDFGIKELPELENYIYQ